MNLNWESVDVFSASQGIFPCGSPETSIRTLCGRWNTLESAAVEPSKPCPSSARLECWNVFASNDFRLYIFYSTEKSRLKIFNWKEQKSESPWGVWKPFTKVLIATDIDENVGKFRFLWQPYKGLTWKYALGNFFFTILLMSVTKKTWTMVFWSGGQLVRLTQVQIPLKSTYFWV